MNTDTVSAQQQKDKIYRLCIIGLLIINAAFICFVFFYRCLQPSTEEMIADMVSSKQELMKAYEVEFPLTRYILLKVEIEKDTQKNEKKSVVYSKISQAIQELESILRKNDIEQILGREKTENIRKELEYMKARRLEYAGPQTTRNSEGIDYEK